MDIVRAFNDPQLFGETFKGETWANWRVILRGLYALPISPRDRAIFAELTGRTEPPMVPASEAYIIAGRRGGKSSIAAGIAVFAAIYRDYRPYLAPGAVATIFVISPDRAQSRTVFRTIRGLIQQSPMLRDQVVRETESVIELRCGVAIEVGTASARTLRGYTCPLVILDELAFFDGAADAADADEDIIRSLLPSLATIPGSLLLGISSPYARRGVLWDRYDRFWGKNGEPIQIYRAPTAMLNPTIPKEIIDAALENDPQAAQAEWLAMFRQDRDSYVSREIVDQSVSKGVFERPPEPGKRYVAFVDPAGGAGADSMALAIAHMEKDVATLDCTVTRRPPFSAEGVIAEMSLWLKKYGVMSVRGDHFSGAIVAEMFRKQGITYTVHGKPKRELFRGLLPMMTSGKVDLLDNPTLHNQLISLERQVSRGGTEIISHPIGGHDDIAVAAAGALTVASETGIKSAILYAACEIITAPVPGTDPSCDYWQGSSHGQITLSDWP